MGNHLTCIPLSFRNPAKTTKFKLKSKQNFGLEEEFCQQQAITLLLHQPQISQSMRFDRSVSQKNSGSYSKQGLSRSVSARPCSITDPVVHPQRLLEEKQDTITSIYFETKKFLLVHGGGFGAWCWYKSVALLEDAGFITTPIDLSGSGINSTNSNDIASLEHYAKPVTDFLQKLPDGEKVIIVGHSFGGACVSFAMERFPKKIAKAIFIAATMVTNEQRAFDVFALEGVVPDDLIHSTQIFIYANGRDFPPTALDFERTHMRELFFNQSSAKDIALATVSMRPIPFAPVMERLVLTKDNYGSVRRFFIQTMDDHALITAIQEQIIKLNPPEQVFKLKGSDHCPFFSKPQSLHKLFCEIAQLKLSVTH
eukprot:c21594_g1_i1 orf=477-1580(-)